jgi:hypothetical protein
MARRASSRRAQVTMAVLSGIVALSLILSLLGPLLIRDPVRPTPTWTPLPVPSSTPTPTVAARTPSATAAATVRAPGD